MMMVCPFLKNFWLLFFHPFQPISDQAIKTKQYNSPQGLYSDDSIKEILSQQAETLVGGVKG